MERSHVLRVRELARRHGDYGFDAPPVPISLGLAGILLLVIGCLGFWVFNTVLLGVLGLVCGFISWPQRIQLSLHDAPREVPCLG